MLAVAVRGIIKHAEIQAYSDNCITSCESMKTWKILVPWADSVQ